MANLSDVCAIVVTYHPDNKLYTLLQALLEQAGAVLIIDNTENTAESVTKDTEQYLPQGNLHKMIAGENLGLGAALNKGVKWAAAQGFKYVLLSDQDSSPTPEMVTELLRAHNFLTTSGHKIAAVGPQCIDARNNKAMPFIQFAGCKQSSRNNISVNENCQIVDFLITSGSLIALNTFETIGAFDDSLFIDNIDIEWCLRAAKKDYICVGVTSATLVHHLGERVVKLLGRSVHTHNPLRLYYRFRNSILLYKRSYIPLCWKLRDGMLLCLKIIFYAIISPQRLQSIRMMLRGFRDGALGVTGKYEQ